MFVPDLEASLSFALRRMRGQRLCVAYSGGLDSTVLLHLLARLAPAAGCTLQALHVHHGLSLNADAWAGHCARECAALGVPLQQVRVAVVRDAGKGLEAAARAARHAAYAQVDAHWVVLAQHADDQAETLLHRLLRGTGVAGAAAMREQDATRRLWRPLLGVSRADLLAWAQAQGLQWIEDESNQDAQFTRNYLRHAVLAPLNQRLPAASRNLARAAGHFAEAAELLGELAQIDAAGVALGEAGARLRFGSLSEARARNLLRYWLAGRGELAPDAARLQRCWQGLKGAAPVREVFGGLAVCAYHQRLWLAPAHTPAALVTPWRGELRLPWAGGWIELQAGMGQGCLRLDLQREPVFRPRAGGERLQLASNRPSRSFRQLCQEHDIPPWLRDELPCLWQGDSLLWIGGVGAAASACAAPGESGWQLRWLPAGLQAGSPSPSGS